MPKRKASTPEVDGQYTIVRNSRYRVAERGHRDVPNEVAFAHTLSRKQIAVLVAKSLSKDTADGRPLLYWSGPQKKNLCALCASNNAIGEEIFDEVRLKKIGDTLIDILFADPYLTRAAALTDRNGKVALYDDSGNFHIFVILAAFEIYYKKDALRRVPLTDVALAEAYETYSNLMLHYPPEAAGQPPSSRRRLGSRSWRRTMCRTAGRQ